MLSETPTGPEILRAIREQIVLILEERDLPPAEIREEDRLNADLGLSSLDLARLVAALETSLGADPFQELVPITSVRTVSDLRRAYTAFFAESGPGGADGLDEELAEVRRLAEARRPPTPTGGLS